MSSSVEQRLEARGEQLQGFSLRDVCWGYRDIFARTIEGLFQDGLLGAGRVDASRHFFELLKLADRSCFDHVLKEFIAAINPRTRWIMDLPGVFAEVVTLGRELAECKLLHGVTFFQIWGEGGFGDTPREVRLLIGRMRRLREVDVNLAMAFLRGYAALRSRLQSREIDLYLDEGIRLHRHDPQHALSFMAGTTRRAEQTIRSITHECRLHDVQRELATLLRALVGDDVEIDHLGRLDSDDLIERGTSVVCLYRWLYVPIVFRHFDAREKNRAWYLLIAVIAAGMLTENSFPCLHGHPRYRTCADLVGDDVSRLNLLQIVEYVRVIERIRARWPGANKLLALGVETEFAHRPAVSAAERLLRECLTLRAAGSAAGSVVQQLARRSLNIFDTVALLDAGTIARLQRLLPGMGDRLLRAFSFLPDFLFPGQVSRPPQDRLIADLRDQAVRRNTALPAADTPPPTPIAAASECADRAKQGASKVAASPVPACFVYDEWCQAENDYYRAHCLLRELRPEPRAGAERPEGVDGDVRRVRQTFERIKPELVRKAKRLREGDEINNDRLLDYVVAKRKEPSPRIDFYARPLTSRRDLAVLVLLDVSGSTGGTEGRQKIIEIEKRTAFILGAGLAALGDTFAVCGFSSRGREHCEYSIYKDFAMPWNRTAIDTLLAAIPSNATRIGPALRHSGAKLAQCENRQRLIVLVTDGKPMDNGYDPNTRYAQYDIRKACGENARRGIQTFAISTEENTRADMELMFPRGRFVILPDMRRLPALLPKLYLRITT
jgi:nitric oxide reductase activation protein